MRTILAALLLVAACGDDPQTPSPDAGAALPACADIPGCGPARLTCNPTGACECRPVLAPSSEPILCTTPP